MSSRMREPAPPGGSLAIVNGRVFTAGLRAPGAEAVAMRGTEIVAVGSSAEIRAAVPGAEVIDAAGRAVLPGLIDAHNHFLATGESLASIDVRYPKVTSVAGLVAVIAAAAGEAGRTDASGKAAGAGTGRPAGYLHAYGFDHAKYDRPPTRWDLDRAAPGIPVLVGHVSGHYVLASTQAMQLSGITEATPDPPGGQIDRDETGQPTGLFRDAAMGLVQPVAVDIGHHGPNFHVTADPAALVAAIERAGVAYLAAGLTTVCDAQVTSRELSAYRDARSQGKLPVRTVCMPLSHQLGEYQAIGLAGPFGDDWLSVGPMKFYCDGSLIGGTAAFGEDARDSGDGEGTGILFWEPGGLAAAIQQAHLAGWQIGVHAQGDAAIGLVLDAFAGAQQARQAAEPRFRIEHAGYPTAGQLARMRDLGVIAVCQPSYLHDSGDEFLDRAPGLAHRLQPLRTELDCGIRVVLSSDSDVASYRPLDTIAAAVERRTRSGRPIGPDQALTIEEAVRAHTIDAAYAIRAEHRIGSLEPGKLADAVILGGDLLRCTPGEIRGLSVDLTVIGGRVAYRSQ